MSAGTSPTADVIDILARVDNETHAEKSFLARLSLPPQGFHLTTLLIMLWGVVFLAMAPMFLLQLEDPVALMQKQHIPQIYMLQIPATVLVAALLGKRYGLITIVLYLLLGFAGLPVFAGGGGWQYLFSNTIGYLLGLLFIPTVIQPMLNKAFRGKGWLRGRSLWMVFAAVLAVVTVHCCGIAGILLQSLRGNIPLSQIDSWVMLLSWPVMLYDILFSFVAVALVRLFRLLFWFCLY